MKVFVEHPLASPGSANYKENIQELQWKYRENAEEIQRKKRKYRGNTKQI